MTVKQNKGFSLLEVVVVVAIVGSIAALGNFGFRAADRGAVLNSATEQFITDFEQMRSNAINGVFTSAGVEPLSYGVFTDLNNKDRYWTFVDTLPTPGVYSVPGDYLESINEATEILLPSGIQISSPNSPMPDIAFELFTGDFYYEGALSTKYTNIILTDTNSGNSKTIAINQEGLIIDASFCGDGIIQAPEQCDGDTVNYKCTSKCIIEDVCGNGILDTGEVCDPGSGLYNQTTCGALGLGEPKYANKKVKCDLTCNWDPVGVCIGGGGGGGGCSISPYTPPDNNTHSSMLLYLLLVPIIILGFQKQIGRVYKIKIYAKKK